MVFHNSLKCPISKPIHSKMMYIVIIPIKKPKILHSSFIVFVFLSGHCNPGGGIVLFYIHASPGIISYLYRHIYDSVIFSIQSVLFFLLFSEPNGRIFLPVGIILGLLSCNNHCDTNANQNCRKNDIQLVFQ